MKYRSGSDWLGLHSPDEEGKYLLMRRSKIASKLGVYRATALGDWWLITLQLRLRAARPHLLITAFNTKRGLSQRRSLLEWLPPCESIKNYSRDCQHTSQTSGSGPSAGPARWETGTVHYSLCLPCAVPPVATDLSPTVIMASHHV